MMDLLLVAIGLGSLIGGGDLLLRGAVNVAAAFGMSRLLIGLTVVSLGTSAPEMAICIDAALDGQPEIALGNIIGSNVANVLLILGLTALVMPIIVERKIIQKEVPFMIGTSLLFWLLVSDGVMNRLDGSILLATMVGFLFWQFRLAGVEQKGTKRNKDASEDAGQAAVGSTDASERVHPGDKSVTEKPVSLFVSVVLILAGAALLWLGAGWLVKGASGIAASFGISQLVIGLTIVAIGSSSPEIVTSILAARRGLPELAVASVIGSNIANLLLVAGSTAVISDAITIPEEAAVFDLPVMIACAVACLPIFTTGHRIARWEGIFFLAGYILFTAILFARHQLSELVPGWHRLVWLIAIPLGIATVVAVIFNWKSEPAKTS